MFELRFDRLWAPLLLFVGIVSLVTALALALLWPRPSHESRYGSEADGKE
jgi:hypothetical protein